MRKHAAEQLQNP